MTGIASFHITKSLKFGPVCHETNNPNKEGVHVSKYTQMYQETVKIGHEKFPMTGFVSFYSKMYKTTFLLVRIL